MSDWLSSIYLVRQEWLAGFAALWCAIASLHWFSYSSQSPLSVRMLGTGVRAIALALLFLCLMEPLRRVSVPKPQANTVAILLDDSRSMRALFSNKSLDSNQAPNSSQATDSSKSDASGKSDVPSTTLLTDASADPSLSEEFRTIIDGKDSWMGTLEETFRVRRYLFGDQLQSVDSLATWTGSSNHTQLYSAVANVEKRLGTDRPSAIVLISDGRSSQPTIDTGNTPVFPVILSSKGNGKRDLWIDDISSQSSEFETAPITIQVKLGQQGFSNEEIDVTLHDIDGTLIETKRTSISNREKGPTVRFQVRPKQSGPQSYRISVRLLRDIEAYETTLENNQRWVAVDRGNGPYRILYVSGRPNWEFKFLRRALSEDPEIQITGLVRIAKKQPKFSFRGKADSDTNPLFSGFEDVPEEAKEQIDEPVFARLGEQSKEELTRGLPKDARELFAYSAIVIDDLELEFFTVEQLQLLREYVTQRGGTLLALGGQESLRGRNFRDSILGQMLPVYGDSREPELFEPQLGSERINPLRFRLTREGWLQPFLRLEDNETDENRRIEAMPDFLVWNEIEGVKAGARVLAEGTQSDGTKLPMLAVQKFGKGTTASLLLGDLWRWALMPTEEVSSPVPQAWRQLIRGLIVDVPKRVTMETSIDETEPSRRNIKVRVKDAAFMAMDNATVELTITPPTGAPLRSIAFASQESAGLYESSILMKDSGVYQVVATVVGNHQATNDEEDIGQTATSFVHEPEVRELNRCEIDMASLARLADESGGSVIGLDDISTLASRIPSEKLQFTQQRIDPLWHSPWWLAAALGCLVAEWWWRRKHGMA